MNNDPQLLSDSLLARRLKIPVAWLRQQADAGRLPHVKAGKRYLFNDEAVRQSLLDRATSIPDEASA